MRNRDTFSEYIALLMDDPYRIRSFVEFCFDVKVPAYFWSAPASSSGKYHGGELLVDHVAACLYVGKAVLEQMKGVWTKEDGSCFIAALLLHDCWRAGEPGKEEYITEEVAKRRGYDNSVIGNISTSRFHPEVGGKQIQKTYEMFVSVFGEGSAKEKELIDIISESVRNHYGPWSAEAKVNLQDYKYTSVVVQVHNVDYHQTKNSMFVKNSKKV